MLTINEFCAIKKKIGMDKKDIYEHLARIYLDASSKSKRKKNKQQSRIFRNLFFASVAVILGLTVLLFTHPIRNKSITYEIALVIRPDVAKINYHFDPARKENYSINLNKLNLTRFKELRFSARRTDFKDNISLRVEFANTFKEKSEAYIKNIPHKWQDYKIPLSDFKNISDWSEMLELAFIVEEWNVRQKRGVVYIDNVRLLR